jgi:hypothetical protein
MSGILLGEGIVCIIFAAPLFYGVTAAVIYINDLIGRNNNSKLKVFIVFPLLLLGSEILDIDHQPELITVSVSREYPNNVTMNNLNKTPDFLCKIPEFFKLGFPKPVTITGTGLNPGDYRKIEFESSTKGMGTLHLKVIEHSENKVVFKTFEDTSHIDHWLGWNETEVSLSANKDGTTTVWWTTSFNCKLKPRWYFEPLEKYAVTKSTNHLIDSYFGEIK